jgi:hypothetical protein
LRAARRSLQRPETDPSPTTSRVADGFTNPSREHVATANAPVEPTTEKSAPRTVSGTVQKLQGSSRESSRRTRLTSSSVFSTGGLSRSNPDAHLSVRGPATLSGRNRPGTRPV